MMVLIYGFSLMFLLAGIMAYEFVAVEVLFIAVVCYLLDSVIFKTLRRFLTIVISMLITLATVTYILYRLGELGYVMSEIGAFFRVYYLSVAVETVSISLFHQLILLIAIGIILMRLLEKYIVIKKINYLYIMGGTVIFLLGGFLSKSMGSQMDQEAFMIICCTMILYYFFNYYRKSTGSEKSFLPLVATVLTFIFIIVIGARTLYTIDPRPLTTSKVAQRFEVSPDVESQIYEADKMSYYKQETFSIQESFEFDNIEVMKVFTENMRYLKSDTYEVYDNGEWQRAEELDYMENDGAAIYQSEAFDQVDYNSYYKVEPIDITMKNISTNVLFMNNYGTSETNFDEGIRIMFDPRRGIYYSDQLIDYNYSYKFDAIIPAYGDPKFDNLVREFSKGILPKGLSVYREFPEEGYRDLRSLAVEITEGIDNPYDKALAIETYLKDTYVYSDTTGEVPEGVDPINYFLFDSGEGFCQQFSSAFILMARSIGIPTRYATGFYVDIFNADSIEGVGALNIEFLTDGSTSVYDSNAHSWAEAYFPEVGWLMFEATPGRIYRKDVAEGFDIESDGLNEKADKQKNRIVDPLYIYGVFIFFLLVSFGYGLYRFYKNRRALKRLSSTLKMLDIHRIIRYYLNVGVYRKNINETPREYASRIDRYLMASYIDGMTYLMKDYEDVLYGDEMIEEEDLMKHVIYLKSLKAMTQNHTNIVALMRMNFYNYMNYVPSKKTLKA